MRRLLLAALITGALAVPGIYGQHIRGRDKRQHQRIRQGVKSGELTRQETRKLVKRDRKLHHQIRRDRADGGGLTTKERVKAHKKQDHLSKQIYKEKHDNQSRN
jgi:hypothetical protein